MKNTVLLFSLFGLSLGAQAAIANGYSMDFESGDIAADRANCWAFGAHSYTNTDMPINGYSTRSNQLSNMNLGSSWIKTPWTVWDNGTVTFDARLNAAGNQSRSIVVRFIAYDANAPFFEGAYSGIEYQYDFNAPTNTNIQNISFPIPASVINGQPYRMVVDFIGNGGSSRMITDNWFLPGTYASVPGTCTAVPSTICIDNFTDLFPAETFANISGGFITSTYTSEGLEVGTRYTVASPNNDEVGEPGVLINRDSETQYQVGLTGAIGGNRWAQLRRQTGTSGRSEAFSGFGEFAVSNSASGKSLVSLRYGNFADLNADWSAFQNPEFSIPGLTGDLAANNRTVIFSLNLVSGRGTPFMKSKLISIVLSNDGDYVIPTFLNNFSQIDFSDVDRINIGLTEVGANGGSDYLFNGVCVRAGAALQAGSSPYSASNFNKQNLIEGDVVNVYPVPASDRLFLDIMSENEGPVAFRIIDMNGRTVIDGESSITFGANGFEFNVSELANGIYTLSLTKNGETEFRRFSVVH